jgi:hypothetical protein
VRPWKKLVLQSYPLEVFCQEGKAIPKKSAKIKMFEIDQKSVQKVLDK